MSCVLLGRLAMEVQMTNSIELDLTTVTAMISNFRQSYLPDLKVQDDKLAASIDALAIKRDDLTYDMVAELVDLAMKLDVEAEAGGYVDFLIRKKIQLARGSANPYMPFIKAVFAELVGGKWEFPEKQRGRGKHANQVRFIVNAKRAGLVSGTVQEFIKSYPDKLKGIEAQDRKDNANDAAQSRVDDARERGRETKAVVSFDTTFDRKDGEVLQLWGVIRSGQLDVVSVEVANDDDANSLFYRLGRAKK